MERKDLPIRADADGGVRRGRRTGVAPTPQPPPAATVPLPEEDPRYYRPGSGTGGQRSLPTVEHAFVAHRDNGKRIFNFSECLGTTSAVVLSNTYHPGNERGFAPSAQAVGYSVIQDMGFDVLREYWPEISHKFKLPFRDQSDPTNHGANSADSK